MEAITKPQNCVDTEVWVWGTENGNKTFTQNKTSYQNSTTKEKSNGLSKTAIKINTDSLQMKLILCSNLTKNFKCLKILKNN